MINITNYTGAYYYTEGKKGYVDKFEKSLKLPFVSALHSHISNVKSADADSIDTDNFDREDSVNIAISSAVTGAMDVNSSDTGSGLDL